MTRLFSVIFILFFSFNVAWSAEISGRIIDAHGDALSFASVVVKGTTIGTTANENGEYILKLAHNQSYELAFYHMGYKTETRKVNLSNDNLILNIKLEAQNIVLDDIKVSSDKKDFAYAIMRKVIAMRNYYDRQIETYEVDAYTKNTITVHKYPAIFKKELDKSGIKVDIPFISESVTNIRFSQPNKREVTILAQKVSITEFDLEESLYLVNFYNPVSGTSFVSPLSDKAFNYYEFEYLGYFEEQEYLINKIEIRPKSPAPGFVGGFLYIVNDLWCLYSIDITNPTPFGTTGIRQQYSPVENAWVPIHQSVSIEAKVLGMDFEALFQIDPTYLALTLNQSQKDPDLIVETKPEQSSGIMAPVSKELTLKELNKLLKQAEKEKKATQKSTRIISETTKTYDSLYTQRDSVYWAEMRSIPLTEKEIVGYSMGDTIKIIQESKADSAKSSILRKILIGGRHTFNNDIQVNYKMPFLPLAGINYNLVEGIFADVGLKIGKKKPVNIRIALT